MTTKDKNELISRTEPPAENIPAELKTLNQWITWRLEKNKDGKSVKIPHNPKTGGNAQPNNPETWGSFDSAIKAFRKDRSLHGIGFVFREGGGFCGIDEDHCRDPETGEISPESNEVVKRCDSYTEISPSGTGIKIFAKAEIVKGHKVGDHEIYGSLHYFTVTGKLLNGSRRTVEPRQEAIDWYFETYIKKEKKPEPIARGNADQRFISEIMSSSAKLWSGNTEGYPSQSEADLALCSQIARIVGNRPEKIDVVFRRSGLFRSKWDEEHFADGKTYGERTIDKATENLPPTFESGILTMDEFMKVEAPPKEEILEWFRKQDVVEVAGDRGVGKSYMVLSLCEEISRKGKFGPWTVKNSVPILYLDMEMAMEDVQNRRRLLFGNDLRQQKNPLKIYNEMYMHGLGIPKANLLDPRFRQDMKAYLNDSGTEMLIIDNLAAGSRGADENVKKEWDPIGEWLVDLRHDRVASMFLHHMGKGGLQRGTSSREDSIDLALYLRRPADYFFDQGARFIVGFDKIRTWPKDPGVVQAFEFQLQNTNDGRLEWTYAPPKKKTEAEVIRLLGVGADQKDIAKRLNVTKGRVSQIRKKAVRNGLISEDGKLTDFGKREVALYAAQTGEDECLF